LKKINNIIMIEGRGYDSNVYIFDDVVVDTGTGENMGYIRDSIEKAGLTMDDLSLIVNTHNHYDHTGGNRYFNLEVAMHEVDAESFERGDDDVTVASMFGGSTEGMKVDRKLQEGDKIQDFTVFHTPGHTKGGICLYDGETLISGDTVFAGGGFGRTDIGGDVNDMQSSLEKLSKLDVKYLLPGHGPCTSDGSRHIKMAFDMVKMF
jgi:glyoxylase-like metal-dependent hydrolase (beta-lactamase superfamily II)